MLNGEVPLIDGVRGILAVRAKSSGIERRWILAGIAGFSRMSNPETNAGGPYIQ